MGGGVANATENNLSSEEELLLILEMKNQLRSQKEELSSTYLSMDNLILMLALMDEITFKPNKRGNGNRNYSEHSSHSNKYYGVKVEQDRMS
jgi:hypothetical protein